jgi:hypothetical protein
VNLLLQQPTQDMNSIKLRNVLHLKAHVIVSRMTLLAPVPLFEPKAILPYAVQLNFPCFKSNGPSAEVHIMKLRKDKSKNRDRGLISFPPPTVAKNIIRPTSSHSGQWYCRPLIC